MGRQAAAGETRRQMGRRPDSRAPRGGFFDEDENDDAPPPLSARGAAGDKRCPRRPSSARGIAADFDDESRRDPRSGVPAQAREMDAEDDRT